MYSPADIASVKALYQNLVFLNLIRIEELDAFGEPIPMYTAEAERQLVQAITRCEGFQWKCHLENAAMLVTNIRSGCSLDGVMGFIRAQIEVDAMLELTESLFPKAELNSMLKDHHEYLDLVQDNVRRGKLFADEMDDSAERVADMRAA